MPARPSQRTKSKILPPFTGGNAFQVVRVKGRLGVLKRREKQLSYVWFGYDIVSTPVENRDLAFESVPSVPEQAFVEVPAVIGGIGKHVRWNVLLPNRHCTTSASLTVSWIQDVEHFRELVDKVVSPFGLCNFDMREEACGTLSTEVVVPQACHIGSVAAVFHCNGYVAVASDPKFVSNAKLALERYDRGEHMWWNQDQKVAGPLRDVHRWKYDYIPSEWKHLPFTWQALCENLNLPLKDVPHLPLPLRDYYVTAMLERCPEMTATLQAMRGAPSVTCRLSRSQNVQLLQAAYWTHVAPFDEHTIEVCRLLRFRYMLHGYTAREIGEYKQNARHLGHGAKIRKFKGKPQYEPRNLSADVLNYIYRADGTLKGSGFKGTRGKYGKKDFPRYQPLRRMQRTQKQENAVRKETKNCFTEYDASRQEAIGQRAVMPNRANGHDPAPAEGSNGLTPREAPGCSTATWGRHGKQP